MVAVHSDDEEEAKLLEEARMPLDDLLAQYVADKSRGDTAEEEEGPKGQGTLLLCSFNKTTLCVYM